MLIIYIFTSHNKTVHSQHIIFIIVIKCTNSSYELILNVCILYIVIYHWLLYLTLLIMSFKFQRQKDEVIKNLK